MSSSTQPKVSRSWTKPKILAKTQDISESYFDLNHRKTQIRTFFSWKSLKNKTNYFYFLQLGGLLVDFHGVRDVQKIVAPPKTRIRCFSALRTSVKTSNHVFWSAKGRTSMKIYQSTDLELLCISAYVSPWIAQLNFHKNRFSNIFL